MTHCAGWERQQEQVPSLHRTWRRATYPSGSAGARQFEWEVLKFCSIISWWAYTRIVPGYSKVHYDAIASLKCSDTPLVIWRRQAVTLRRLMADSVHAKAEIEDWITCCWGSITVDPYGFQSSRRINSAFGAWRVGFLGCAAYGQSQNHKVLWNTLPKTFWRLHTT